MKQRILFLNCCIIILIVTVSGCKNEPENITTSSDGVKISFDMQGEGNPALIFIHGWSNNRSIWDAQVSHFSEKYKVVNIDLPGFGKSGNNRQNWTMASFGNDVSAVINKLDLEQVVLVGFSMGGPVAIETANIVPERVIGVVLVDIMHNVEMNYPPPNVSYIDSLFMDLVTNPTNEKLLGGGFYKKNPEAAFKRVLAMLKDTPKKGWSESLKDLIQWENENCIESLKKIQAPIISINTDISPTNVVAFKKLVPSFQAKIVPDVGHLIMWDAPEEFNRLLEECIQEFLK